ncbi:hypothetical protein [Limosilactobacillus sp.]|uniref:hypothetical protein n=1 Tax=Limosilactobacillus sp. TaxID=2773925 RepID=UPI003EFF645A
MNKFIKKTVVGIAALTTSVVLAACGQQTASQQSSHSSSSTPSAESESTRAYHSAEHLIRQGEYKAASNTLSGVSHSTKQVNNLNDDLRSYMSAEKSYSNGNYDEANNSLSSLKSNSSAMRGAYNELQNKISNAEKVSSSSSSATSSSMTSAANSSSAASQSTVAGQTSTDVVNNFASKMGFANNNGYSITPTAKNGNTYRFEVRQNNKDNTVANMVGIYQYNNQTGVATKIQ